MGGQEVVAGGGPGHVVQSQGAPLASLAALLGGGVVGQPSVEQFDEHRRCWSGGPAVVRDLLVGEGGGGGPG